jgi:hypothetical protein
MRVISFIVLGAMLAFYSCKKDEVFDPARQPDTSYNPQITWSNFSNSTTITNPYFPFDVGRVYIYESQTGEDMERTEVAFTDVEKTVMGIPCVVIRDRVYLNGQLIEDTHDWFAQDNEGNVWYMGEDVQNYNLDGTYRDSAGAWEAGIDDAKPGFMMLANPQAGMTYRQEYYFNHAEDEAQVEEVGLTISTPLGTYENCIRTKEWTDLEPDVLEYKFYAPHIGVIKTLNITDNEEANLIEIR